MRTLGVLVCLAALVVGAIGVHQRTTGTAATRALDGMAKVSADGLRRAQDGDTVIVEGRVDDGETVTAPISERPVAWWWVERTLHQQVETQDCSGGACRSTTRQELSDLGTEAAESLAVRVGGDDGLVAKAIVPNDPKAVAGMRHSGSAKEDDPSGGNGWVEVHESVLVPGDRVTLAGARHGDRDAPTIHKVDGIALVHAGSRDEAIDRISADQRAANTTILGGVFGFVVGVGLFMAGRRRARANQARIEQERAMDAAREARLEEIRAAEAEHANSADEDAAPTAGV